MVNILGASIRAQSPSELRIDNSRREFIYKFETSVACPSVASVTTITKANHRDWSPAIMSVIITIGESKRDTRILFLKTHFLNLS